MMNEVTHKKTEEQLKNICGGISQQVKAYKALAVKIEAVEDQAVYSKDYLERQAADALKALENIAESNRELFISSINAMIESEKANDNIMDFQDETLKGVLNIIQALNPPVLITESGLTAAGRILYAAIMQLRGKKNALYIIRDALAGKGVQIPKGWDEYFYDDSIFDRLSAALYDLTAYPRTAAYYSRALTELKQVYDVLALTPPAGAYEEMEDEKITADAMRSAFGLA